MATFTDGKNAAKLFELMGGAAAKPLQGALLETISMTLTLAQDVAADAVPEKAAAIRSAVEAHTLDIVSTALDAAAHGFVTKFDPNAKFVPGTTEKIANVIRGLMAKPLNPNP